MKSLLLKLSRCWRLRQAAEQLWDIYHGFHMPDAPKRGEIDAAWEQLRNELRR